jgi:hypothetical protein
VLDTIVKGWQAALADLHPDPTTSLKATLTPKLTRDSTQAFAFGNSVFIDYKIEVTWKESMRTRKVTVDFSI